jgi:hypothetical protein
MPCIGNVCVTQCKDPEEELLRALLGPRVGKLATTPPYAGVPRAHRDILCPPTGHRLGERMGTVAQWHRGGSGGCFSILFVF